MLVRANILRQLGLFLLNLQTMDYTVTPFAYSEKKNCLLSALSYPAYLHFISHMVTCCSELRQRRAIPLFLVGQRREGKLPMEVEVSAVVGLWVQYVMSNTAVPLEQAVKLNKFLERCFWHSLRNAYAIHVFKQNENEIKCAVSVWAGKPYAIFMTNAGEPGCKAVFPCSERKGLWRSEL